MKIYTKFSKIIVRFRVSCFAIRLYQIFRNTLFLFDFWSQYAMRITFCRFSDFGVRLHTVRFVNWC